MAAEVTPTAAPRPEWMEYTSSNRITIMIALMMGTLMQMIDTSIVNVAVPTMQGNLGATLDQISWVATGYILANVITLPLTGWLSHLFGRRYYLAGSMALFTLASLFCGMAGNLPMLIFFRMLQGVGGAALMATAQATMMEIFPPAQLGMVQAVFGVGVMVGPALGPTLGGWLVDNFTWPWIFYINIPVGILATFLTMIFMHDSKYERQHGSRVDLIGILLLAVGLGSLQTLLEKGTREGWFQSTLIVWLTAGAVVGVIGFIIWELRVPHPVLNLRVLRHRGFSAGVVFGTVIGFGLYGGMFILPVFLQGIRRYTAMQSGLIMIPGAIATALAMPIAGRLVNRTVPRNITALGMVGAVVSMFMLRTIDAQTGSAQILWPLILRGASLGLIFVPMTIATLAGLPGREMAEGSALFNLMRQLGGSAGIAYLSTFINHRLDGHYQVLAENITLYNPAAVTRLQGLSQFFMSRGYDASTAGQQALSVVQKTVLQQSAIMSYQDAFVLMGFVFLATMPLLLLFEKRSPMKGQGKPAAHLE
ncbi:MAG: DHA2 family efflux MFS transporter permease subunit [Armatimonadia bacterium]